MWIWKIPGSRNLIARSADSPIETGSINPFQTLVEELLKDEAAVQSSFPKNNSSFPGTSLRKRGWAFCKLCEQKHLTQSQPKHTCFLDRPPGDHDLRWRWRHLGCDRLTGQSPGEGGAPETWKSRDLPKVPQPLYREGPHTAPGATAVLVGAASVGERA